MNELLTVIVPAYNVEKYIGQCLDSLVHQTLMNHKIIIVNDGSTDNTEAICLKYRNDYPDIIKYIYQDNQGLGAARNTGMTIVDTPWVTFLDSDDWWNIRYVEVFTKWLNKSDVIPEIIFTLPWVYDNNNARINIWMDKYVYDEVFGISHDCCKCQYKNVQKEENINVQSAASSFSLLSFHDRSFVLKTIRGTFDGNDYGVMQ